MKQISRGLMPTLDRRTVLVSAGAFGVLGCSMLNAAVSYRVRLKVRLATAYAVHEGSSVLSITWEDRRDNAGYGSVFRTSARGEAPLFSLGNTDGVAVALLVSPRPRSREEFNLVSLTQRLFRAGKSSGTFAEQWEQIKRIPSFAGEVRLAPDEYPDLVRFSDPLSPASVVRLRDGDLLPSGSNVRIELISVQITEDPVSNGIVETLPWLATLSPNKPDPIADAPGQLAEKLYYSHFKFGDLGE